MRAAALALFAIASCAGQTGTIQLELTTAPGSPILDGVQHLRVTVTDPLTVVEADRTDHGFDLAIEVDATGGAGALIVEGFDGGGAVVAVGSSPAFPVAAINAHIVIYMAAPLTIGASPARLPVARTGVSSAPLTFGFAVVGGEDAGGVRTDTIFLYNAFDHSLLGGLPMPAPRAFQTVAVGSNNAVYLFGGVDATGAPAGSLWRFDTTAPPSGSYTVLPDRPELARSGSSAVRLAADRFVISGTPPVDLSLTAIAPRTDVATLSSNGASVVVNSRAIAIFAGDPIQRLDGDTFDALAGSVAPATAAGALLDGRVVFAGAGDPAIDLVVVTAATGTIMTLPTALSTERNSPAISASSRYLVIAGGTDATGQPIASADIFDTADLNRIATVPCLARSGATAHLLANDQIAIVGGTPANDLIELFTPPVPLP